MSSHISFTTNTHCKIFPIFLRSNFFKHCKMFSDFSMFSKISKILLIFENKRKFVVFQTVCNTAAQASPLRKKRNIFSLQNLPISLFYENNICFDAKDFRKKCTTTKNQIIKILCHFCVSF